MPRIVGVDVPNDKAVLYALTYVHGIGKFTSAKILSELGIDFTMKASNLTEGDVAAIAQILDRDYLVEGQLRRQVSQNIIRLKDIACYRGLRHRRGLPVRGQQTQSNARTRKGKKKTVAGKKGVKELR